MIWKVQNQNYLSQKNDEKNSYLCHAYNCALLDIVLKLRDGLDWH